MTETASDLVQRLTTIVPDFPKPGILFRDVTPVFADAVAFGRVCEALAAPFAVGGGFAAVAGIEARGFALAGGIAAQHQVGVLTVRKAGKLPGEVLSEQYALEYGEAELELRPAQLPAGTRVLVVDDVLATGGTGAATITLLERAGYQAIGFAALLELDGLQGRERLEPRLPVTTLGAVPA
ncbi:adenine phosphoribosyltransferase [Curtobacterium sp. MCLR17_007]|uniref:adenine phosphoribosyltransferase n=1 Tax=unclassified Curtobacterium TaxID=257496 RepID=UPI0006F2C56F|nr:MULTISPECIES: adenine phosphoribosyltransferase [unclassified Curtobacterium]KQS07898.1 adenine phosphoribosyltransferase [Curtobacterium sp. Leaf183]WIB58635.1 adenine phosphoribosyltransferase [Curtobacterium sp. MCLR17_007]